MIYKLSSNNKDTQSMLVSCINHNNSTCFNFFSLEKMSSWTISLNKLCDKLEIPKFGVWKIKQEKELTVSRARALWQYLIKIPRSTLLGKK